jgi:hypothetical protein
VIEIISIVVGTDSFVVVKASFPIDAVFGLSFALSILSVISLIFLLIDSES